jgi:N-acetylneuraminic acid mutarotase
VRRSNIVVVALATAVGCSDDGVAASGGSGDTTGSVTFGSSATDDPTEDSAASASASDTEDSSDPSMGTTAGSGGETGGPELDPTTAGRWEPFASLPAGPRQETAVVALGDEVFVLGGFMGATVVDLVEAYDPEQGTWRTPAALPEPMHHVNAGVVGGRIYVAGFLQTVQFTTSGRLFVYDPADDAWTEGTPLPLGREAGSSGVAVSGSRLYVFGGLRATQAVAEAQFFDVDLDAWTPIASLPSGRDHLVGAAVEGRVYAVGGRAGTIGSHTAEVLVYDEIGDAWTPVAPMPTSRGGMGGAVLRGWIFVAGGEGNADDPSGVFDAFEAYDPVADVWHVLTPMLTPRHGTGAATVGDRLWVPGGATEEGFGPTDVAEVWIPE